MTLHRSKPKPWLSDETPPSLENDAPPAASAAPTSMLNMLLMPQGTFVALQHAASARGITLQQLLQCAVAEYLDKHPVR